MNHRPARLDGRRALFKLASSAHLTDARPAAKMLEKAESIPIARASRAP